MNSWRCIFIYLTVSCSGPSIIGQQMANGNYVDSKIENLEDGAIRATAYSGIQSNQKINYNVASSDLYGASISISPGALSISSS